jgi:hypothetical protein
MLESHHLERWQSGRNSNCLLFRPVPKARTDAEFLGRCEEDELVRPPSLSGKCTWRGGRVVECTGFENQQGRKLLVGSNPTLSADERREEAERSPVGGRTCGI